MLKVFRIITSIRLYAGMLSAVLLMVLIPETEVFSFRWVPSLSVSTTNKIIDTTYFSQKQVSDYIVMLTYSNISVWHTSSDSVMKQWGLSDLNGDITTKALTATKNLNTIRSTNVLQINNSDTSVDGVGLLLQQTKIVLNQSQSLVSPLQQMIDEEQAKIDNCTSQKSDADKIYNEWLKNQQSLQVSQATLQAQEASVCIATATVSLRSKTWVLNNLTDEISKTQDYEEIITRNKDLITKYGSLLDGTIPSDLVQVQNELSALQ